MKRTSKELIMSPYVHDIGRLMHDFRCKDASEMNFRVLSDKVRYLKTSEGGQSDMGNVFDDIRESSQARGEAIGAHKSSIMFAEKLIRRGKETYDEIAELTGLSSEEISELAKRETA